MAASPSNIGNDDMPLLSSLSSEVTLYESDTNRSSIVDRKQTVDSPGYKDNALEAPITIATTTLAATTMTPPSATFSLEQEQGHDKPSPLSLPSLAPRQSPSPAEEESSVASPSSPSPPPPLLTPSYSSSASPPPPPPSPPPLSLATSFPSNSSHSHSHSHSHSPSLTSLPHSTSSSPLAPPLLSPTVASPSDSDISSTAVAATAAKTAPEQQQANSDSAHDIDGSTLLLLDTKTSTLQSLVPAPVAHPHPRSRQHQQERPEEFLSLHHHHHSTTTATTRANIINTSRYQEQEQEQQQELPLSPADIPSLSLVHRRQTTLFGLGPFPSTFSPLRLVVLVTTTTTISSTLDKHYCPTDLILAPYSYSCTCCTCCIRSTSSLPLLLQRVLSHLQSWSFQSLFVAYSLPLLACLTPGLVLPLSIFQLLSFITSSSSFSTDQPPSHKVTTNDNSNYTSSTATTASEASSPSFIFSLFSSSPTTTSIYKRHSKTNSISSPHSQATIMTARPIQMSSSSSSSSSSTTTESSGGSSSSARFAIHPPPIPSQYQAQWTSSSSSSSSSATTTTPPAQSLSQQHHVNQHSFTPSHIQATQQHQAHFRQSLARHQDAGSTREYDDDHEHGHEHEHEHEYDHGSDDESEGDAMSNEMEYYLQRCSICFDSRLDFCLEMCRDQFCRDCFQKYVKEVVSNSWGLDVTKIKCPVCQDPLPLSEWSKYVDQGILAQYQQYNQPYRSFSRFCNDCDNEVVISQVKQSIIGLPSRDLLPLFESLLEELKSLLVLGGLHPCTPSLNSSASVMFSSMDGRKRHKHGGGFTKCDAHAQDLVQQFIKDYQSFCGTNQSHSLTLPSMAQSYFSSLAMRALGGGGAPPTLTPSVSGQQSNVRSPPSGGHGTPAGGQPVGHQQRLDTPPTLPPQISLSRNPSSLFQRKQQPIKSTGVLEMYKDLMVGLIALFDLNSPKQVDSAEVVARINLIKETNDYGHMRTPVDTNVGSKAMTATNLCGSDTIETIRTQKRTLTDRSKVVTRAESKRQLEIKKALVRFSKELLSLEVRPEQWKELQFLHVRWCRWDWCNNCDHELCLQCGVSSHHESETCFDHMRSVIMANTITSRRSRSTKADIFAPFSSPSMGPKGKERSDLDTGTMQWKLANTNPCPNCCILIHRDDGCNKVDCMLCGHRFCWVCREAWDVGCGFFRCRLDVKEPAAEKDSTNQWEKHPDHWDDSDSEADAEQVEALAVGMGGTPHNGHGQTDDGAMRHDRRRRQSEDIAAAISEKPEIGVPNVFMIQAKRSRA